MSTEKQLLIDFARYLESRHFANALHVYDEIKSRLKEDEWSEGYLHALKGIYLVKRTGDQYAFFSNNNPKISDLRGAVRRLMKNAKAKMLPDFERGYFSAAADYTKALIQVLKTKKNQKALLEINEEDVRIVLMDQAGSTFKTFTFKTIEKAGEAPKIPELAFTAEARLSSNAVSDSISQLAKIDSQIKVMMNESVEFEAKNESVKAVEKYVPRGAFIYDLKVEEPAEAYFSANYLEKIAKAAKKFTNEVEVKLSSNKPIKISPLIPFGSISYLVAPIIGEA